MSNVAAVAGPLYLGTLLNWGLYGILVVQVYIYWTAFPSDQWHTKTLVYSLFILDTLQSILLAKDGFATFASGFGNKDQLNSVGLVWFSVPVLAAVVSLIVECFFAYRIWVLSGRSYYIPSAIVATSVTQAVAAILAGIKALQVQKYSLLQESARVQITVWHVGSAACDVLIALSMCYYLWKRDTGFKRTHTMIVRLIQLTIETGTATASVAIIDLILFSAGAGKVYFITPAFVISKLYANTVVVIFNNRAQIVSRSHQSTVTNLTVDNANRAKDQTTGVVYGTGTGGPVHFVATHNTSDDNSYHGGGIEIQKSVAVWRDGDDVELSSIGRSKMDSV
ncbi:hypothetical protein BDN70DRAFT_872318 [Pholiota conissans]|uniref:DUF6534 domain-containing protein n=1 Tax=Pholiota conissans TaxID=109636 RepID=A0A9P6D5I2_9AGAR|nr:hypothetical protein BDN70DRAFT_872318 [Pholiota conissans]